MQLGVVKTLIGMTRGTLSFSGRLVSLPRTGSRIPPVSDSQKYKDAMHPQAHRVVTIDLLLETSFGPPAACASAQIPTARRLPGQSWPAEPARE